MDFFDFCTNKCEKLLIFKWHTAVFDVYINIRREIYAEKCEKTEYPNKHKCSHAGIVSFCQKKHFLVRKPYSQASEEVVMS